MPLNIGIIGAGVAGLTAARLLSARGHSVLVLDKGRRAGGRVSTKVIEGLAFDHGPPWFSIDDPGFRAFLDESLPEGCIMPWTADFARLDPSGTLIPSGPEPPRYVGVPGMGSIGEALAKTIDVRLSVHVNRIDRDRDDRWNVIDREGAAFGPFDWVIANCPPAQSGALLRGHSPMADRILAVPMAVGFALMLAPEGGPALPFDGIECDHPVLRWASNEQSKPGRSTSPALVFQSTDGWAEEHREDDRAAIARNLRAAAEDAFGIRFGPAKVEAVHRWLYARPARPLGEPAPVDRANHLASCGDWCLLGSIEGAFLSGLACSRAILDATV